MSVLANLESKIQHEEATNIELFFDLFFAANLTVFSEVHDVTNLAQLRSYMGYFCMLWFTWALVGLFDVRFVTDSIFGTFSKRSVLPAADTLFICIFLVFFLYFFLVLFG